MLHYFDILLTNIAIVEDQACRELNNYLEASVLLTDDFDALNWWKENRLRFPIVGELARRWLCVPATSTPSERVFSDCGVALNAKRSRLDGDVLESQIIVRQNIGKVSITDSDIRSLIYSV